MTIVCERRRTGQRDHCLPGLVLGHVYYARSSTMPGPRSVPPSRFITTTTCYPDKPPPPSLPILLQTRPGCPARHLFCRQFKALGVVAPNPLPRRKLAGPPLWVTQYTLAAQMRIIAAVRLWKAIQA